MLNPKDLQDAIVAKLQAIPELIAAVGGADAIEAYDDESLVSGDPDTAEQGMLGIALLVLWTGMELPRTGELGGWTHTFRIALKAASIQEYFVLAQLVFDGVPTGD